MPPEPASPSHGRIPWRLDWSGPAPALEWLADDGLPYTEPFFHETLARLRRLPANRSASHPTTPLESLRDAPGPEPDALLFHISRCGSTLVAQMLASLPEATVVLAEPPLLDEVLRLHRHMPDPAATTRAALARGAVAALASPRNPGHGRLFVKLDCWHLFELPLLRQAFPRAPCLFIHRDPIEVLVSLARMPSLTLVRDTVTPAQLGLTPSERNALSPEAHAAAILGALFREATHHRAALTPVAYTDLPHFVWQSMPGVDFSPKERALLKHAATRDAKNPGRPFTPDAAAKHREASPTLRAAAERWTLPAYQAFLQRVEVRETRDEG